MSKISTALRAAALGPAPRNPEYTVDWFGNDLAAPEFKRLFDFWLEDGKEWVWWRTHMNNDERRMFLLFCAEAEE